MRMLMMQVSTRIRSLAALVLIHVDPAANFMKALG